jgi:5'-methylthioadenosine phosphorylase
LYRQWGASVIGMTNLPEAKLAREAELCYATVALTTDYDCWHETHEDVSVEAVLAIIKQNVATAKTIIKNAVRRFSENGCSCSTALQYAIITDPAVIPEDAKERLALIVGRYLK